VEHPARAETVDELAVFSGEECFLRAHDDLAAIGQRRKNPVGFFFVLEIDADA